MNSLIEKYFPTAAHHDIANIMEQTDFQVIFTRHRNSKLGDFRPPRQGKPYCCITLNNDLNPYQMLITFLHEVAHYMVFKQNIRRHDPHGKEWKQAFQKLLIPFLKPEIFPDDILEALQKHIANPKATSGVDIILARSIMAHNDIENEQKFKVEDLAVGTVFRLKNHKVFIRDNKLRKRIRCRSVDNGQWYLFNPLVEVEPLEEDFISKNEIKKELDKSIKLK